MTGRDLPEDGGLEAVSGRLGAGSILIAVGCGIYGLGRIIYELTLIRKYLNAQHYSRTELHTQVAEKLRDMSK